MVDAAEGITFCFMQNPTQISFERLWTNLFYAVLLIYILTTMWSDIRDHEHIMINQADEKQASINIWLVEYKVVCVWDNNIAQCEVCFNSIASDLINYIRNK